MWETDYAREPIDYRLLFLRLLKKLWILPFAALAMSVIVGLIYILVAFGINGGYKYRARTIYYVTYEADATGKEYEYYNYYTWQELIHTDYFVQGLVEKMGGKMSAEEIIAATTATVESDYRYLYTKSERGNKEEAIELEKAVSELILNLPEMKKEIESIEVIDPADLSDVEDISLIFVKRAFIFGAIIGVLAFCVLSVFAECVDTSVHLPSTLEKRYHIPAIGAESMKEFQANCRHFLEGKNKVGFIPVDANIKMPKGVSEEGTENVSFRGSEMRSLLKYASIMSAPEAVTGEFEKINIPNPFCEDEKGDDPYDICRSCDGLILVVRAGAHNGKKIERLLEQLSRQDIKPTAFMLVSEDEWLIRNYYRG